MSNFDIYPRIGGTDAGVGTAGVAPGAVPATGLTATAPLIVRVPMTAGAGTTNNISFVMPYKARLIDCMCKTTSTVSSATFQVFTATGGGGTACTSSIATATAGVARDALTTATQVFAAGATVYCYQSGGATLSGGEAILTFQLEQ